MKKVFVSCLVIVLALAGMCIAGVLIMFLTNACPPQGPWPLPPWCEGGISLPAVPEDLPELVLTEAVVQIAPTPTPLVYVLPPEELQIFSGPGWEQAPSLPPGFMMGNTFMDVYGNEQFNHYLDTTIASMETTGANWVIYGNFWSYHSLDPPIIAPFPDRFGFRDATAEEIEIMAEKVHQQGMKFALIMELNWDVLAGSWESWEKAQRVTRESQQFLEDKSMNTEENTAYWDSWFESYTAFALDQAAVAQAADVDMLVIGQQLNGAVVAGNIDRWKTLIAKVREVYDGPISYAAYTNQYLTQADSFPYEDADYIIIYYYNGISELEQPGLEELRESFEYFNDTQFEPLSRRYGKPVIFLTPFQSRDFGARQEWFEPSAPAPEVGQDLLIQAKMYEAFFQSIQDEDWVAGVWTWGYWWRDDFIDSQPGDSSYEKSSTIRNKPAMWIFQKWARGVTPTE